MSEIPSGRATVFIAASPEQVYQFITDVAKLGTLSPECIRSEWNEGQALGVGATFHGWNKAGDHTWDVECEVTAVESNQEFTFLAGADVLGEKATTWRFILEPTEAGTQVTESFEAPLLADPTHPVAQIPGRAESMTAGMQSTLQSLKAAIESAS